MDDWLAGLLAGWMMDEEWLVGWLVVGCLVDFVWLCGCLVVWLFCLGDEIYFDAKVRKYAKIYETQYFHFFLYWSWEPLDS